MHFVNDGGRVRVWGMAGALAGVLLTPAVFAQPPDKPSTQTVPVGAQAPGPRREIAFAAARIALSPPENWRMVSPAPPGMLMSCAPLDAPGASLSVALAAGVAPARLPDDLPAQWLAAMRARYPDFKLLGSARTSVAGADAFRVDGELRTPTNNIPIRNRQVYVVRDGRMYLITLTARGEDFNRLTVTMDKTLQSIRWL